MPLARRRHTLSAIGLLLLLLMGSVVCAQSSGPQITGRFTYRGKPVVRITVPGRPPAVKMPAVAAFPKRSKASTILASVPAFDWSYGCSATSAAMIAGHYDNAGFPGMYTGGTNGGVCPLTNALWGYGESPISASHDGLDGRVGRGHVDDYWITYNNAGPDPYISGGWTEHTPLDCTADFMGTSMSKYTNVDGATSFYNYPDGTALVDYTGCEPGDRDGCHGFRLFIESRGYRVFSNFSQYIYGYNGNTKGYTFADFQADIQAGNPVILQVTNHSMVGYGYDTAGSTVYLRDTWDHNAHNMTWAGSYSGLTHYGVCVLRLDRPPTDPGACSITPATPNGNSNLTASYATPSTDPNGTGVSYVFEWRKKPSGGAWGDWTAGAANVNADATTVGDTWQARVAAYSGSPAQYSSWSTSAEVVIAGQPPTDPTLSIGPSPCTTVDDLVATPANVSDPDGDPVTAEEWEWYQSADNSTYTIIPGETTGTLPASATTRLTWYKARYRYQAGGEWSNWAESASLQVSDSLPTDPTLVVDPAPTAATDLDLSAAASGSTDADGDEITYDYQWDLDSGAGFPGTFDAVIGALVTSGVTEKGQRWQARARAASGGTAGNWVTSTIITITDTAPTVPSVYINPLSPNTSHTLGAVRIDAYDLDGDPISYRYQWRCRPDATATWGPWEYDDLTTIGAAETEHDEQWQVRIQDYSGTPELASAWSESAEVTILNSRPSTPTSVTIIPAHPRTYHSLYARASGSTDTDGDALMYRFQWSKSTDNGSNWSPWTWRKPILDADQTTKGELWRVRSRAADYRVTSGWRISEPVTIGNSPPTTPTEVVISPASPVDKSRLTVAATGSTDPDGDSFTYVYEWSRSTDGGLHWSPWQRNGNALEANQTVAGEMWVVHARARDVEAMASGWRLSEPVTIGSGAAIAAVTASIAQARNGSTAITVSLTAAAEVDVRVTNLAGLTVATLPGMSLPAGLTTLNWNGKSARGSALPQGSYLVTVTARTGDGSSARYLVPLRR